MRRYCKDADITNIEFIERCIYLWLEKKKSRRDVQRFLAEYSILDYRDVRKLMELDYEFLGEVVKKIAKDIQRRIICKDLQLPPIWFKRRYDDSSKKWRKIGIQKPIHQIFDYIVVESCREMFLAKIGPYQMASLPKRGQEQGVKVILKWLQLDKPHTRYYVKGDVRQCYPSIPHDTLKALFARDLKNPLLLWLIYELIDSFPEGLSIGSYFSQYACNYYLSYAYHYVAEQMRKTRRKRGGEQVTTRLVYHQLFYMDDVLFLGSSKKDLKKAMELFEVYCWDKLGLEIKPGWEILETDYIGQDGQHHGRFIDMMGYRIYSDHVTIRRGTFKKVRRAVLRAQRRQELAKDIPLPLAHRVVSFHGRIKNSDSHQFSADHNLSKIMYEAKKVVSADAKRRNVNHENESARAGKAG